LQTCDNAFPLIARPEGALLQVNRKEPAMTVIVLSLAALGVVALIAAFASRWDKKSPEDDPDLPANERRAAILTTAALAASVKNKKN
jgi:hypothetical protein